MYEAQKTFGKFFVTSGYSSVAFKLLKETFNQMAFLVLVFVKRNGDFAIATRFYASDSFLRGDLFSKRT